MSPPPPRPRPERQAPPRADRAFHSISQACEDPSVSAPLRWRSICTRPQNRPSQARSRRGYSGCWPASPRRAAPWPAAPPRCSAPPCFQHRAGCSSSFRCTPGSASSAAPAPLRPPASRHAGDSQQRRCSSARFRTARRQPSSCTALRGRSRRPPRPDPASAAAAQVRAARDTAPFPRRHRHPCRRASLPPPPRPQCPARRGFAAARPSVGRGRIFFLSAPQTRLSRQARTAHRCARRARAARSRRRTTAAQAARREAAGCPPTPRRAPARSSTDTTPRISRGTARPDSSRAAFSPAV